MKTKKERVQGHGLELNVHRFFHVDRSAKKTVLLLHGYMDAGGSWHDVAETLVARDIDVWAIDFRGFGESDRVSGGGYYHFPNYVADVAALARHIDAADLTVAGHSMGGTVAVYFAATRGEALQRLVLLEGIGPPAMPPNTTRPRMIQWLDQLAAPRQNKPLASLEDAARRLAMRHTAIDEATLVRIARHLTVERDGALHWAFDPLHRSTSPGRFDIDAFHDFLRHIPHPTLFISGGKEGLHPPDETARVDMLPDGRTVTLEGAGHMMHWTQPTATGAAIADFVYGNH